MQVQVWLCCVFALAHLALWGQETNIQHPERVYDFGKVGTGTDIQHTFTFLNTGSSALEIKEIQLTPPLVVANMSSRIEPGAEARMTVQMQKSPMRGDFYGAVAVHFKNADRKPEQFYVQGSIVPPIEFIPHNVIFLSTQRGQPKSATVEIVNHELQPIEIRNVECNRTRFNCELETLEAGKRYQMTLTLRGDEVATEQTDVITLPTSSRARPFLEIKAFSKIRERVYAFPDQLDLETIDADYLKARPQMVGVLTQSIMVYQAGGDDFRAVAQTDVPFLRVSTSSSARFKDRIELTVSIDATKLKSGPVKGSITVGTNDPQFSKIEIPVFGRVEGNY